MASLQDREIPLMEASKKGKFECMQLLLNYGAQANIQDEVSAI